MRGTSFLFGLGLLALTGGMGYGLFRQHATQTKLYLQLQQLDEALTDDNDHAAHTVAGALEGLQAEVVKNQNQPHDVALLTQAEAFASRADSLVRTLRTRREELLRASGNPLGSNGLPLPHPEATEAVATQLAPGAVAYQNLTCQLADYAQAGRQLSPNATGQLAAPSFSNMPVVAALAHLTRLESDVRAIEFGTLRQLSPRLGARKLNGRIMAVATAEANAVAPGTTYRAKLYVVKVLQGMRASMTCNGQFVRVGPDGQGLVRFVAPNHPGPAAWHGTIHFNNNGRDTTFQVRVPYRVAPR
ncbi:hypothetical protein [Hymenobacter daeguensis]